MSRSKLLRVWLVLSLVVVCVAVVGCSGSWHRPRIRLPRRGPVDLFEDIVGQVSRLGESLARQFRGLSGGRP